ncbi:MAG: tetratricopeptide repeat protein [Candidatus Krumholzibacteriia bacterium]
MTKVRFILLVVLAAVLAMAGCRSAHTTSAILYIEEQQYQKAVNVIHEGFRYRDDEPDAYYWLGEAYSKLAEEAVRNNDFLAARRHYELSYESYLRAVELGSESFSQQVETALLNNYTLRSNEAKQNYQQQYYEQAEGHFRLAYAALPDSIASIRNIASMKMEQAFNTEDEQERRRFFQDSLALLDQVLAEHPDAYLLQVNKASVLAQLGRADEAGLIYDELLREHADDPVLLQDVARLSLTQGDYGRAAELNVRTADIYANDTDPTNDDEIKQLLVNAGTWFALPNVARFEEALAALDRAAEREVIVPSEQLMLTRVQTYYQYGKALQEEAEEASTPERQAELLREADAQFQRSVEVGNALTNQYPSSAEGYLYLMLSHIELEDMTAAEINQKQYEELRTEGVTP